MIRAARAIQRPQRRIGLCAAVAVGMGALSISPADATQAGDLITEEVSFAGGDGVILHGTIVAPAGESAPLPGLVLVHGGGQAPREWHLQEAEAFARAGIATLIYDKRTEGYSLTERSYSRLADDALAAFDILRTYTRVDADRVGLWGVSEGGWVAPLAASRSADVAFVITVGASGVPPARQEAWAKANRLREAGVSGSMVRAYATNTVRVLVDAGMFPEAYYDARPVLEELDRPILAIWGAHEQVSPPAESLAIFAEALRGGGNSSYTLRVLPEGDHAAYRSPDGGFAALHWVTTSGEFAPGYVEMIASWVDGLAEGEPPSPSADTPPEQETSSAPLPPLDWYESARIQLAAVLLLIGVFAGYLLAGVLQRLRRRRTTTPAARPARWLASIGLVTVSGTVGYFGIMLLSSEAVVGPVIAGRALPWLALQLLSIGIVLLTAATAIVWWRARGEVGGTLRPRLALLLTAGSVFVPWALYWGLLLP